MTMTAPRRRVWLYPDTEAVEIVLLGPLDEIGIVFAAIKSAAERWSGFSRVEVIASGSTIGAIRARLNAFSRYYDPIAEALIMLAGSTIHPITWTAGYHGVGMVGTW